ncbi:MAG: GNAT family N-acetyltransferase [Anaerolineae bacterium]|nr:GNAT family N-acetyltransferase [Anaerolineae bacterium]
MVATAAPTAHMPNGLRPMHPRRDLAAMADLIEVCFADTLDAGGRSMLREMRIIAKVGPLAWRLARAANAIPALHGFVWMAQGKLVGNVSLSRVGYDRGWVVANVAVYPEFRRRGIARQLMQAALATIASRGRFAVLQVDAPNTAARHLYETLGFRTQRIFTRWRRASYHKIPPASADPLPIRRMQRRDAPQLLALAEVLRPNRRGGLGWLRPTTRDDLRPPRLGFAHFLLSGQQADYWVVPGPDGVLQAALRVEQRIGGLTSRFDLLVAREHRGTLEPGLINFLLQTYPRRSLVTDHPADDPILNDIVQPVQFRPERLLAHMIWHAPDA